MRKKGILLRLLLTVLVAVTCIGAADITGSIDGLVKDPSGAVAPAIEVSVANNGTNAVFHAVTDSTGAYFIRELPVGEYTLTVEPKGFKKFVANDLRVQVNESIRVDINLEIGDLAQTVDVSGVAETVDTNSITLKNVVDQQRIENLPLNGRNPTQLICRAQRGFLGARSDDLRSIRKWHSVSQ